MVPSAGRKTASTIFPRAPPKASPYGATACSNWRRRSSRWRPRPPAATGQRSDSTDAAKLPEQSEAARTPVDDSFTSSVFYDPKTKYIWDLLLDREGRLYVATGDRGEIFRVTKSGEGSVFFK